MRRSGVMVVLLALGACSSTEQETASSPRARPQSLEEAGPAPRLPGIIDVAAVRLRCDKAEGASAGGEQPNVAGAWLGQLTSDVPGDSVTLRLVLRDEGGSLEGDIFVKNPSAEAFYSAGELKGVRCGASAEWVAFEQHVFGVFANETFRGRVQIVVDAYAGTNAVAELRLTRE